MQKIKLAAKPVTLNQTMIAYTLSMTGGAQFYVNYQLLSDTGAVIATGKLLRQPSEFTVWANGNNPDNLAAIGQILSDALAVTPDADQTMPLSSWEKHQADMKAKFAKNKAAAPKAAVKS